MFECAMTPNGRANRKRTHFTIVMMISSLLYKTCYRERERRETCEPNKNGRFDALCVDNQSKLHMHSRIFRQLQPRKKENNGLAFECATLCESVGNPSVRTIAGVSIIYYASEIWQTNMNKPKAHENRMSECAHASGFYDQRHERDDGSTANAPST